MRKWDEEDSIEIQERVDQKQRGRDSDAATTFQAKLPQDFVNKEKED